MVLPYPLTARCLGSRLHKRSLVRPVWLSLLNQLPFSFYRMTDIPPACPEWAGVRPHDRTGRLPFSPKSGRDYVRKNSQPVSFFTKRHSIMSILLPHTKTKKVRQLTQIKKNATESLFFSEKLSTITYEFWLANETDGRFLRTKG